MVFLERLTAWDAYIPEWVEESGAVWLSHGAHIFRADGIGNTPRHVATVPCPAWQRVLSQVFLFQRALRLTCYNLIPLSDGSLFVSFAKSQWRFTGDSWHSLEGLARPFRILRGGCAKAEDGSVFFGEYFDNSRRDAPVHVYRLRLGSNRAEVVHTFPPSDVRHIHAIHMDPFTGSLWLCTGDRPSECRLLRTCDGFRTFELIGAGDESWRAIQLVFKKSAIYYATDAEFADNHIFRLDRETGKRMSIAEIDGPSFYGAAFGVGAVFATTAELCQSQQKPEAVVWHVDEEGVAAPIAHFSKDLWAARSLVKIFQAGLVQFPSSTQSQQRLPFTGSGLVGLNGRMFALVDASA